MPSVKVLEQKKKIVSELCGQLKDAKSMVFADYMGLNVAQDTEMRAAFREAGLQYRVVKNTITSRVFDEMGLEDLKSILVGPTAVAYSAEDPILAPRLVAKYRDEFKKLTIKGGVMDGEIISLEMIDELAKVPTLPVLYGRLVSTLMFPISSLAITLNLLAQKAEEAGVEKISELTSAEPAQDATDEAEHGAETVAQPEAEEAKAKEEVPETESEEVEKAPESEEKSAAETGAEV
ncbi:MAG TPA: 50S ribosomal protein L10 [Clostridiaceae bacterium]|nr:50S ribosomal protein L10 [Clostridiaceae bacterium]